MRSIILSLLILCPIVTAAQDGSLPDEILALHWQPGAAGEARRLTLAAAVMLERLANGETIPADALARRIDSERASARQWFEWVPESSMGDGLYAILINRLEWDAAGFPEPVPGAVDDRLILKLLIESGDEPIASVLAARWQAEAGRSAPEVWRRVVSRVEGDAATATREAWSELATGDVEAHALELARHARELAAAPPEQRLERLARFRLLEVEHRFARGEVLGAVWSLLELLIELTDAPGDDPRPGPGTSFSLREHIAMLAEEYREPLVAVDPVLLTSMAQIGDAGALLAAGEGLQVVARPLADAYGQLALFIPDTDFYIGQPVRRGVRESLAVCREAAGNGKLGVEVVERQTFDACLAALFGAVAHEARTEDLAGDRRGPFAPEALRRELGLVSWQRIRYLLGYLDWVLGGNCPAPDIFNVLETALGVEQISYWTSKRKVYFRSQRWRDAASELRADLMEAAADIHRWTDCVAGSGGARRDPVERLIAAYRLELMQLTGALSDAREQFREQVLSPGSDVRFGGGAEQQTNWRPEGLRIGPCDPEQACGMSTLLPVTRALLGRFPQPYLLASQTGMGEIRLCYDNVRWTERRQQPSRRDDERVANYHGKLSFELAGRYVAGSEADDVFRLRMTTPDDYNYLFAASDPEILEMDCPRQLAGRRIESTLPDAGRGLVPDRLTYFATAPTIPSSLITANWDRGQEWRDWFLTGQHVEVLTEDDGSRLLPGLEAQLRRLAEEQDRTVTARLLRRPAPGETDPLTLNMARLSDLKSLTRRALELVHPIVLRYHEDIRAAFTGEIALLDRDEVRRLRERNVPILELPMVAHERAEALRARWLELPETMRHGGQPSPELIYALLRLAELEEED